MTGTRTAARGQTGKLARKRKYIRRHWPLYLMLIPGLVYMIVFKFLPYYGLQIAFRDYNIFSSTSPLRAITASKWVGMKHLNKLFQSSSFATVLSNTLIINGMRILFLFPLPIIIAILLVEIRRKRYRSLSQTAIYVPYFFSWSIIYGIFSSVLDSFGLVNQLVNSLGFERIPFLTEPNIFRGVLIFTDGWKTLGYNAVIYLAAITGLDPQLYEAARIDGASKWRQIWNITLPGILPTIVMMLILKVGHILDVGWEQVLIFYNPAVYEKADVIQTYVYRIGIGKLNFSQATAMELFNSVVAFILIIGANTVSKKTLHRSIW